MDEMAYFFIFFAIIVIIFLILYAFIPNKKYLEPLDYKKAKSAESMMLYGIIPIGTLFLGSRRLDKEQLEYYGLLPDIDFEKIHPSTLPRFRTKFLAFVLPLIPLRTQIMINEEKEGLIFRKAEFYAIPVKMHWKQVFSVLSWSYAIMFTLIIVICLIMH